MGGMLGESKYEVLGKVPHEYTPKTILISLPVSVAEVTARIKAAGLSLPLIFKPDIGERGFMVMKVTNESEVKDYLKQVKVRFLVQDLVQLPLEFGVFYMRLPTDNKGKVISLVAKEMLFVTGDGKASLKELIFHSDRAKLQWHKLKNTFHDRLDRIIPLGETIELVSIGNHALGTRFINANHLITGKLSNTFDGISHQICGFYFGRFDLRCSSLENLYEGNVKIMELNGCGADPAHIYDRDFSLWKALGVLIAHWHRIFKIALANKKQGVNFVSHREAFALYRKFKSVVK